MASMASCSPSPRARLSAARLLALVLASCAAAAASAATSPHPPDSWSINYGTHVQYKRSSSDVPPRPGNNDTRYISGTLPSGRWAEGMKWYRHGRVSNGTHDMMEQNDGSFVPDTPNRNANADLNEQRKHLASLLCCTFVAVAVHLPCSPWMRPFDPFTAPPTSACGCSCRCPASSAAAS